MTHTDQQILAMVDEILTSKGIAPAERLRYVHERARESLPAFKWLFDRFRAIKDPPRTCQVEHAHWEGPMICGQTLPCRTHGGG